MSRMLTTLIIGRLYGCNYVIYIYKIVNGFGMGDWFVVSEEHRKLDGTRAPHFQRVQILHWYIHAYT